MNEILQNAVRPNEELFQARRNPNDPRLGEVVASDPSAYSAADIVILGCPQDQGVQRNGGRIGAASAPDIIRKQFYKLTTFNVKRKIFDAGNVIVDGSLEAIHERHSAIARKVLKDGKRMIVLGGGNDVSYPDGVAMAETFGAGNWIAVNVDAHLDVRDAAERNSGTPYRQLLEGKHLTPSYFYEVGYQSHFTSPVYYEYIRNLGVNRISLELLRSRAEVDLELREQIRQKFIGHSSSLNTFFGFDLDVVRMSDAPGTSAPSPLGLRAGEFIQLVKYAASLSNTRMIEFSEVNPEFDIDDRTSRLVAIAMHRFCTGVQ